MKRAILVLSALAILLGGTRQANGAAINPAVEYSTVVTDFDGHAFTLGYKFTTSTTLDVNALGYWVDGQGNNHQVGIWNSVGGLLASTTVLSTDVVVGHFQYHSIPDLILAPGTYTIGGEFFGGTFLRSATGVVSIGRPLELTACSSSA